MSAKLKPIKMACVHRQSQNERRFLAAARRLGSGYRSKLPKAFNLLTAARPLMCVKDFLKFRSQSTREIQRGKG